MPKTPSAQINADRTSVWLRQNARFAQVQPPAAQPAPAAAGPAAPVSGQQPPQPAQPKATFPATLEGCKVTFDSKGHMIIDHQGMPSITLALTHEQKASVEARLGQKDWGTNGGTFTQPSTGNGKTTVQRVPPPPAAPGMDGSNPQWPTPPSA